MRQEQTLQAPAANHAAGQKKAGDPAIVAATLFVGRVFILAFFLAALAEQMRHEKPAQPVPTQAPRFG
jgi:hypothetical protein